MSRCKLIGSPNSTVIAVLMIVLGSFSPPGSADTRNLEKNVGRVDSACKALLALPKYDSIRNKVMPASGNGDNFSAAQLAINEYPTPEEVPVLKDYYGVVESCRSKKLELIYSAVPESKMSAADRQLLSFKKNAWRNDAITFAALLQRKIAYGDYAQAFENRSISVSQAIGNHYAGIEQREQEHRAFKKSQEKELQVACLESGGKWQLGMCQRSQPIFSSNTKLQPSRTPITCTTYGNRTTCR